MMQTEPSNEVEISRVTKILGASRGANYARLLKAHLRKRVPLHARYGKAILEQLLTEACKATDQQLDVSTFEDAFAIALADQRRADSEHANLVAQFATAIATPPSNISGKAQARATCNRFYRTQGSVVQALKVHRKNTIVVCADSGDVGINAELFSIYLGDVKLVKITVTQTTWPQPIATEFTNIILYGHVAGSDHDPFFSEQLLPPETVAMFLGQRAHVSVIGCVSDSFTRRLAKFMPHTSFIWTTWPFKWRSLPTGTKDSYIDAFNAKTNSSKGTLIDILSYGTSVPDAPVK